MADSAAARADPDPGPKSSVLDNNTVGGKPIRYQGIHACRSSVQRAVSRRLLLGEERGRRSLMAGPTGTRQSMAYSAELPITSSMGRMERLPRTQCQRHCCPPPARRSMSPSLSDVVLARDGWLRYLTDGPRDRMGYRYVRARSVSTSGPRTGAGGSRLPMGRVKGRAAGHWQHRSFRRAQQAFDSFDSDLGDD